jgi:hypothetical protein
MRAKGPLVVLRVLEAEGVPDIGRYAVFGRSPKKLACSV